MVVGRTVAVAVADVGAVAVAAIAQGVG